MSEQRDYDLFLKGDLRVDGYQSDWLKKTLAEREARGSMPRPKAVPVPEVVSPKKKRIRARPIRPIWVRDARKCSEPGCDKALRKHCTWDKCRAHSKAMRGQKANEDRKARKAA